MEEIVETMNFSDDGTSFNNFSSEDHFEFGGKGKARRAARQEAKAQRKEARTEKKLAKAELKRSKGEAKIIAAQSGTRTGIGATIGNILGGVAKAVIPGGGASSEEAAAAESTVSESGNTASVARTAGTAETATAAESATAPAAEGGGMSKKMKMGIYIGGGVLLVGILAFVFLRPKKTA